MINVDKYLQEYREVMLKIRSLGQPESTGGMTGWPGQFIYAAVRTLKPLHGLEIGTRNGMSAAIAAAAMERNNRGSLTTLDVVNVLNYEARPTGPNRKFTMNPQEIQDAIGVIPGRSTFIQQRSTDYMNLAVGNGMEFDYILLDGSHNEDEVYEEVRLASHLLADGGIVILDDVYPEDSPLPQHAKVIRGPWKALERAVEDGILTTYHIPNPRTVLAYIRREDFEC